MVESNCNKICMTEGGFDDWMEDHASLGLRVALSEVLDIRSPGLS